jgi:hypothetical protein
VFPFGALPKPPPPPPDPPSTFDLTRRDLLWIAREANVFKIMGERKVRTVTIDFVPARPALVMPRFPGDDPITACPPHIEEVVFHLEDTMFGGETFASLTCRGMVIVVPFLWSSWDTLAKSQIVPING